MTRRRIVVLSAGVALAAGVAMAVAGTPFGGDDLGTIPTDSPKGPVTKCESGVAKAASKLVGSILKCHTARASGKLANDAAENMCEGTALTKFGATKTAGCAACTNLTTLGQAIEAALDTNNNKVACTTTGTPFGGDDTGNIPADAPKGPVTKCEGGVDKAVGKLVGSIVKCHISRATGKLTDDTAEDACEATAKTKFGTTKTTGCDPCLGPLSTLSAFVEAQADGVLNALVWCGGGTTTTTGTTSTTTTTAPLTVTVGPGGQLIFDPATLTIKVGDTVHWVWATSGHSVVSGTNGTADNQFCSPSNTGCANPPLSLMNATYEHTFTTAGTFPYYCSVHFSLGMTGTITVQ